MRPLLGQQNGMPQKGESPSLSLSLHFIARKWWSAGWTGMSLKALFTLIFASRVPGPSVVIFLITSSILIGHGHAFAFWVRKIYNEPPPIGLVCFRDNSESTHVYIQGTYRVILLGKALLLPVVL